MTTPDEAIYAHVASEIKAGFVRPGLWTMALAKSGYDESAAKALYIEFRAQTIKLEQQESVKASSVSTAFERIRKSLDHEKARLFEDLQTKRQRSEDAKLEKWKRGIAAARKYLENPMPIEVFAARYQISEYEIHARISQGTLRAYRTEGEHYIDEPFDSR